MLIRQGDILLRQVDESSVPDDYVTHQPGPCVVGLGEATGHTHTIERAQWVVDGGHDGASLHEFAATGLSATPVFVYVAEETLLTHPEHASLAIPDGTYQIVRQREYEPRSGRIIYVED